MIRFDNVRFAIANGGLEVFDNEVRIARLNSTQSLQLLTYLENSRAEFEKALPQASEPATGSSEWHAQKIAEASEMPDE